MLCSGNYYDVALFDLTGRTALYSRAACAGTVFPRDLHAIRRPGLRIDQGTACHERTRTLHNVVNLRHLVVHGGGLRLALSPIEQADGNIMPSCIDHSKIWKSIGLSWPYL